MLDAKLVGSRRRRDKITPRQLKDELAALASGLRQQIEAEVDGFDADPKASALRRERALGDYEFFAKTYFPHYVRAEPSALHRFVYRRFAEIASSLKGEKDAVAAPRGEAKSTLVTQIGALWHVARSGKMMLPARAVNSFSPSRAGSAANGDPAPLGLAGGEGRGGTKDPNKHYILILMDAFDQAASMLEAIKAELEFNPRLKQDFPEICGAGRVWREGVIVTANDVKVQALGSGKRLRGLRHGPYRPDFVVLDDIENDENVENPRQRDKTEAWINKAVLNVGAADDSLDVFYIGTILHYDSALARTMKNPLWRAMKFQAVIRFPDRMDLWQRWEEVLRNDGEAAADAFHAERRDAMDRGAQVSWPAMRPFEKLMKLKVRVGQAAFDSELQNDPISLADAPFGTPTFWVSRLPEWIFFGSCDPSLGREDKNRDPSAILVGGFDREKLVLDIVAASIRRRLPDTIIEDLIAAQQEHRCFAWGIEAVQFQEFFAQVVHQRAAERGIAMPVVALQQKGDKELRIQSLHPYWSQKRIRLHPSLATLIEQARHWPKADHDDGLDGLEMLWRVATGYAAAGDVRIVERRTARTGFGGASLAPLGYGIAAGGRAYGA